MTTPLPPTDPSTADELLPGEAELAALYRQLPRNEPGPALDAAVLRAAAQALNTGEKGLPDGIAERRRLPREKLAPLPATSISVATSPALQSIEHAARARRQRAPRWPIALGSAASLVLVAGLAWHMRETAQQVQAPAASLVTAPSPLAKESPAPAAPPALLAEAPAAKPLARRIADAAAMLKQQKQAARAVAAPSVSGRGANSAPPAVADASLSEMAVAPRQAVAAKALGGLLTNADQAAPPLPAPARSIAPMGQSMLAAPAAAPSADANRDTSAQADDTPAQELVKISQLFAQDHDAEALQRLRVFQQAHPQWPLPPALRTRLGQP